MNTILIVVVCLVWVPIIIVVALGLIRSLRRLISARRVAAGVSATSRIVTIKNQIANFFKNIITKEVVAVLRIAVFVAVLVLDLLIPLFFLLVAENKKWFSHQTNIVISCLVAAVLLWWTLYRSIRKIPAQPPHKGVLLFLGIRLEFFLSEGWCLLPLWPWIFNAILVKVVSINEDIPEQQLKTPDGADLLVGISYTITPGNENGSSAEKAKALIMYLNRGGREEVKRILEDAIRDRARTWFFSDNEGPANWKEAMGAKDSAVAILVKAILGDVIKRNPAAIPTDTLMRFYSQPPQPPLKYERKRWGKQSLSGGLWEGLEGELNKLTQEEQDNIKLATLERMRIVGDIRRGNGEFFMPSLGVTLNRLNITNIVLSPEIAKAVRSQTKEKEEKKAEVTELKHVANMIKMVDEKTNVGSKMSAEIVTAERGKSTMNTYRIDSDNGNSGASSSVVPIVLPSTTPQKEPPSKKEED